MEQEARSVSVEISNRVTVTSTWCEVKDKEGTFSRQGGGQLLGCLLPFFTYLLTVRSNTDRMRCTNLHALPFIHVIANIFVRYTFSTYLTALPARLFERCCRFYPSNKSLSRISKNLNLGCHGSFVRHKMECYQLFMHRRPASISVRVW